MQFSEGQVTLAITILKAIFQRGREFEEITGKKHVEMKNS